MQSLDDGCANSFAEGVRQNVRLNGRVNLIHIAYAATQYDAIGVEQIDDLRQRTAQSAQVPLKALRSRFVAVAHGLNDVQSRKLAAMSKCMVSGKTRPADPSL